MASENKGTAGQKAMAAAVHARDRATGWLLLAPGEANRVISGLGGATVTWICIGLGAVLLLSSNIIASQMFKRASTDLTENKLYTISRSTKRVLGKLQEPIDVRIYYSSQLGDASPNYKRYFERVRALLDRYGNMAGTKLKVSYIDPVPFSDAEDRAVSAGLKGVQLNAEGDKGYFGLVASNSTDNTETVPFFSQQREAFLEYDMTRLIHKLAVPKKLVVGLMSALRINGGLDMQSRQRMPPWKVIKQINEFFEVRQIAQNAKAIDKDVDVLMLVHPNGMSPEAAYAVDQFALGGGRVLAFVDPVPDVGRLGAPTIGGGTVDAQLAKLLKAWGVAYDPTKVVGDIESARRVQTGGAQPVVTEYVVWLGLKEKTNIDAGDVTADGVKVLNLVTAGALSPIAKAGTKFQPIMSTSANAMLIDAAKLVEPEPDPVSLLRDYKPGGKPLVVAARVTGDIKTAFPEGLPDPKAKPDAKGDAKAASPKPAAATPKAGEKKADAKKGDAKVAGPKVLVSGKLNAIIVADTDFLFDQFWVQVQNVYGQEVEMPIAHNAVYVVNALENLSGGEALSGLRGRGVDSRPFDTVDKIRRAAEKEFREREKALSVKLDTLREQLSQVQKGMSTGGVVLSDKDKAAVEKFKGELIETRQQLRNVKLAMRADIDQLEGRLKFINIAAVPLLIGFGGLAFAAFRRRRRRGTA